MTPDRSEYTDKPREQQEAEPVVVRDRRRIDPETGQRRIPDSNGTHVTESMSGTLDDELAKVAAEQGQPEQGQPEQGQPETGEASSGLEQQVNNLTADLKRVTAEYANYRKRVDRDREAATVAGKASVASDLLTVLDDIERADAHGDLTGAFKAVTDKLIGALTNAGLESFGQEGDEFDPSVHEAVQHATSPEVSGPTVTTVMRAGYRLGDRVLRPSMVGVTDYEPAESDSDTGPDSSTGAPDSGAGADSGDEQPAEQG